MKTKYSPGEDDPIIGFCNATSESRESALFFLEGFNWDLDNAVSSFFQGQLPPVKKQPLKRSPSSLNDDNIRLATHVDISHGEDFAPMAGPVNHESDKKGPARAVTESSSH